MSTLLRAFLIICGYFLIIEGVLADLPPDPGEVPTGVPVGGGAPLGGGLFTLLMSGVLYGFSKLMLLVKQLNSRDAG